MQIVPWKTKNQDSINDFLSWDRPLLGLSLFPETERFLSHAKNGVFGAVDISEENNTITVKADVPGLKKEEIVIDVDNNVLTIRGERKLEKEQKEKNYYRLERSQGVFERSFDLGTIIDQSKVKASYKDGVLEIQLPKAEAKNAKRIAIEN